MHGEFVRPARLNADFADFGEDSFCVFLDLDAHHPVLEAEVLGVVVVEMQRQAIRARRAVYQPLQIG